ncbi:MAG: SAM-dependent methyltransferase [Polyangiaceae bacterium]|nr:SAM-dependent methyltransferase [Myxococcales bacterium]MCB9585501.1 SAM-dependent methyltransferase [Polyangiaceae bacterium]
MRDQHRSFTSDLVAAMRAFYSETPADLDVASDPVASSLLPLPLTLLVRAMGQPGVSRLVHRALGHASFGLSYGVPLRTAAIDEVLREEASTGCDQLVLLGAGLDARGYRLPELSECTVFELDHPSTQAYKRLRVGSLDPLAKSVHFCSIDFERQSIGEVLGAAGFATQRKSCWIWEGVTMYLTPGAIDATLDAVSLYSAPGSVLCMTYVTPQSGVIRRAGLLSAKKIREPILGTLQKTEVRERLERRGFSLLSDTDAHDWAQRYWQHAPGGLRVWERLVVARRA